MFCLSDVLVYIMRISVCTFQNVFTYTNLTIWQICTRAISLVMIKKENFSFLVQKSERKPNPRNSKPGILQFNHVESTVSVV